jgi:hypothetical protein
MRWVSTMLQTGRVIANLVDYTIAPIVMFLWLGGPWIARSPG